MTGRAPILDIKQFRDWLATGERGLSSEFIVEWLTAVPLRGRHHPAVDWPLDPDDLRRCLILIDTHSLVLDQTCLRTHLARTCEEWRVLVDNLGTLRSLLDSEVPDWREKPPRGSVAPKTYQFMQDLFGVARLLRDARLATADPAPAA